MKRTLVLLSIIFCFTLWNSHTLVAQSDPSAIMNVQSTDKGILIPRMTTAQRTAITNPAKGLLVFDNTTNGFWFYNGTSWDDLRGAQGPAGVKGDKGDQGPVGDSFWIKNGLNTYYNNGNVGIGVTSPVSPLDIKGINNTVGHAGLQLRSGNTSSTFGSNQIALGYNNRSDYRHAIKTRHNGGSKAGNALDFYIWDYGVDKLGSIGTKHVMSLNGGNVGIGTHTPEAKLHVTATGLTDANNLLRLGGQGNFVIDASGIIGGRFTVKHSGNVGIGIATPSQKLHVKGDILADNGWVRVTGENVFFFQGHGGGFYMNDNTWIRTYGDKSFYHNKGVMRTDGRFEVGPLGGNRFAVTPTGNVGIGITAPSQKLHVKGDILVDNGWVRVSGQKGYFFQDYGGGFYMKDNTWIRTYGKKNFFHETGIMRTDGQFQVGASGARFIVNNDGNVGIGTTAPGAQLHVSTVGLTASDVALRVGGNGDFAVDGSGKIGGRLVVKHNGNVGIGIINPTNKLQVENGNVVINNGAFVVSAPGDATGLVQISSPGGAPGVVFTSNLPEKYRADIRRTKDGLDFGVGASTAGPSIKLTIKNDGKVVIGSTTTPEGYNLYVEKGILTEHIRAALKSSTRWADDAFGNKPDLKELEAFIKQHSHLIGVPSAEELVETGIDMVEMDATLLRQIEWLWEEAIESEREKEVLHKIILELKNMNQAQNTVIKQLNTRMKKLELLILN